MTTPTASTTHSAPSSPSIPGTPMESDRTDRTDHADSHSASSSKTVSLAVRHSGILRGAAAGSGEYSPCRASDARQPLSGKVLRKKETADEKSPSGASAGPPEDAASPVPVHEPLPAIPADIGRLDRSYELRYSAACTYLHQNDLTNALRHLNEILSEQKDCISALELHMHIQMRRRVFVEALTDADRILALVPMHPEALKCRIQVNFDSRLYPMVLDDARSILKSSPRDSYALKYLGACSLIFNLLDDALVYLKMAHTLDTEDNFTALYLARAYHMKGDDAGAMTLINHVLTRNPSEPDGLLFRALIYFNQNQLEKAKDDLDKIEGFHQNIEYRALLGRIDAMIASQRSCCVIL